MTTVTASGNRSAYPLLIGSITDPREELELTMSMLHRFMYFTAACALFAPVAYAILNQAAQIVA